MKSPAILNFIAGFSWKPAAKPDPETVETFNRKMNANNNHEIWRNCNSCGESFDVRKELKFVCPSCGSVDLSI